MYLNTKYRYITIIYNHHCAFESIKIVLVNCVSIYVKCIAQLTMYNIIIKIFFVQCYLINIVKFLFYGNAHL